MRCRIAPMVLLTARPERMIETRKASATNLTNSTKTPAIVPIRKIIARAMLSHPSPKRTPNSRTAAAMARTKFAKRLSIRNTIKPPRPRRRRLGAAMRSGSARTNEMKARNVPMVATIAAVEPNHRVATALTFSSGKSATSKLVSCNCARTSESPAGVSTWFPKHQLSKVPQTIAAN